MGLRPASAADFHAFYGRAPAWRVWALVVEAAGGKVLGIGGFEHQPPGLHLFMDIGPGIDVRAHRRALILAARTVLRRARESGRPLFAVRDPDQPRSRDFLNHFGFVPMEEAQLQEVWRWRKQ